LRQSIADYDELIKRDPRNAAAYMGRASVYDIIGEYTRADADGAEAKRLGN
jgi:Tfp pilus assembly protein PilF